MPAVVPSMLNTLVVALPSQPTSCKLSISCKDPACPAMTTCSASCPSATLTLGSKHSLNTTSSNGLHWSKRHKVDREASANPSMLQRASYALEMLSHGGLWSHVISALVTDDTIQLLYYNHSVIILL